MNISISNLNVKKIENLIITIRGEQVMLDSNLAGMYGVDIRRLNEQVKRNITRFPQEFMFQINESVFDSIRSQNASIETEESLRSQNATFDEKELLS